MQRQIFKCDVSVLTVRIVYLSLKVTTIIIMLNNADILYGFNATSFTNVFVADFR